MATFGPKNTEHLFEIVSSRFPRSKAEVMTLVFTTILNDYCILSHWAQPAKVTITITIILSLEGLVVSSCYISIHKVLLVTLAPSIVEATYVVSCRVLSCLALPCLALPCLALPCLALPCLALPCLALPCLALPCLALPCLALPCLALPFTYILSIAPVYSVPLDQGGATSSVWDRSAQIYPTLNYQAQVQRRYASFLPLYFSCLI